MPARLDRIRQSMDVQPTPRDKGLELTIRLKVYDNGLLELDGIPLNDKDRDDPVLGWLAAGEVITSTLTEFYRQVAKRRAKEAGS